MSISKEVTVWCDEDGCHEWTYGDFGPAATVREARAGAARLGWRRIGALDVCPEHMKERQ